MSDHNSPGYKRARALAEKLGTLGRLGHQMRTADTRPTGAVAILAVIDHHGRLTGEQQVRLGQVSHLLHRSMPSVTRSASQLEQEGLVAKTVSPQDRRGVCLSLTDRGRDVLAQSYDARISAIQCVLERLGEGDTDRLLDILDRLGQIMDDMQAGPPGQSCQERNPPVL